MSYDLHVWGTRPADMRSVLDGDWTRTEWGFVLETPRWQISVYDPQQVEPEDVPDEVAAAVPGPSCLIEVSLAPISAPWGARRRALKVAKAIASAFAGAVEDPQENSVTFARGLKRFDPPRKEERFAIVELSWWYLASPLRTIEGTQRLLSILERNVKEAIPRRYGLWEPPQHKTESTGRDALAAFMCEPRSSSGVYYSTRPVVGFHLADSAEPLDRRGFRSNLFQISIEAAALSHAGWGRAVRNLWREVSRFLRPFYGEARVLRGHKWAGATTASDMQTDNSPVASWWWRGIPPEPGIAMVLGPPYTALWQPRGAVHDDELLFCETDEWSRLAPMDLEVPDDLALGWMPEWTAQPRGGFSVNYPEQPTKTWPFG